MKISRVDQYGSIIRLAEARKTYASVADEIKPDLDVVEAMGQLMDSMVKIAESRGEDTVGSEEIIVAMERLAEKGYRVDGSPLYFAANAEAMDDILKTAGIGDWAGNVASWMAGKAGQGAQALQQAPGAAQQALQKGWQTAKDVAGKAVALPGQAVQQGLESVKQKAQDVQVGLFEKAKQQMAQSLQSARSSFNAIKDVLEGRNNRINLPALRQFSTAMAALMNAANTLNARTQASRRPEAAGTVPGGKSVSAPPAAQVPAAGATAVPSAATGSAKSTMVRVAGWDESAYQKADQESKICKGFDGVPYTVGDRVELHPGTDYWMKGARFGEVVAVIPTPQDRVRVKLDKVPGRVFSGPEDRFKKA